MTAQEPESVMEELRSTIVDEESPMDQQVPGTAFAVVGFSYLVILFVAVVGLGFAIWLFR